MRNIYDMNIFVNSIYTNWMPGQLDDYKGHLENCIEYGRNYNFQWNDAPCNDNQRVTQVLCGRYVPSMVLG
ncbi:hypothetical protein KUTeg_009707 [Tegillarca granosa]|uniref:C-type lectin domain-containing protein n=1 Tax=Tegillarca granosa TaxID=220873 RepID=A0ABQ9F4N1_TEGGR|nr:hypothetical protein KUTeg_009707 [Tegillarca granosa]